MNLNLNIPAASPANMEGGWRIDPAFLSQVKKRLTEYVVDLETIEEILLALQSLSGSSLVWHALSDGRLAAICVKCQLKVDAEGKPDKRFYTPDWIINFLSDPRPKCDHRRAPSVVVASQVFNYGPKGYDGPEVQDTHIEAIKNIWASYKKMLDTESSLF